jgi:hypothetical protein
MLRIFSASFLHELESNSLKLKQRHIPNLSGSVMRRREAIRLFSEICGCIPEALISCASLTPSVRSNEEFELRINASLDVESLKNLQSLVNKHGMVLKEDKGSLLIYKSETKPTEMQKRYEIVRTQSSDGEIHLILNELRLNDAFNNRSELNETQIKEIMKNEAQKPLRLTREYE